MEKQVIFRDRQEMTAEDLNNIQGFSDEASRHFIQDAISAERYFVGLKVTKKSATDIEIASGRLWDGKEGAVYELAETQTHSVFSMLPLQDQRWFAVSVFGQVNDSEIQPRDFLIDIQSGQTQPEAVAMERRRVVISHIASGLESPTPQKPEPPTGYTLIAYVRLSPSGIEEIVLNTNATLPRLDNVAHQVWDIERWRAQISPRIETMQTDIAGLQVAAKNSNTDDLSELFACVARLQEQMAIPDEYAQYSADYLLDTRESDVENAEFHARVEEGIRMPWDGVSDRAIKCMNPYEKAVTIKDGLVLPLYSDIVRLETVNPSGSIPIAKYQYQTVTYTQAVHTSMRIRYGGTQTICTNSMQWQTGKYDPFTHIFTNSSGQQWLVNEQDYNKVYGHEMIRMTQVWTDYVTEPYFYPTNNQFQINGAQIAQTFLNSQNGWLTGIGLWFSKFDKNAPLTVLITETELGMPNIQKTVGSATVKASDFAATTNDIVAKFTKPLYLEGGKRYAMVLITAGDHEVHIVAGSNYTQGTLFESVDGAYFQGDNTRDLRFRLYFAKFAAARTTINLEPLELAGGITDIDILTQGVTPNGCELHYEYQHNGNWIAMSDGTAENLNNLPPLLPFRVTFIGTSDLAPALAFDTSRLRVSRPAKAFRHFSTERTLPIPKTKVEVQALLEGFDDKLHTFDGNLLVAGKVVKATEIVKRQEPSGVRYIFRYTFANAINKYVMEFTGTSTTALKCFHVAQRIDMGI